MFNLYKTDQLYNFTLFYDEPYSKREAYGLLLSNAVNGKILCSIRQMADYWQWSKSKAKRFLDKLKAESIIETEIKSGKLLISISNYASSNTTFSNSETVSGQNRDSYASKNYERDKTENGVSQQNCEVQQEAETNAVQNRDVKEEKKKRSKKRKEERFFKEKNIPFGDIKKEKEENVLVPFELVKESDIEHWVTETIKVPVNIAWELDKFKDYWLSTRKKPPKDGIAAFRNWLRKSIEINNKYGGKSEQFNRTSKVSIGREPTGFERFLTGGLRAVDKLG